MPVIAAVALVVSDLIPSQWVSGLIPESLVKTSYGVAVVEWMPLGAVLLVSLGFGWTLARLYMQVQHLNDLEIADSLSHWLSSPANADLKRMTEEIHRRQGFLRRYQVEHVRAEAVDRHLIDPGALSAEMVPKDQHPEE